MVDGFTLVLYGFCRWPGSVQRGTTSLAYWGIFSVVHSKMIFLICYLLDYQQVHDTANVSIILLGDKKEPTK